MLTKILFTFTFTKATGSTDLKLLTNGTEKAPTQGGGKNHNCPFVLFKYT
jgi:hypothetical protein